MQASFRILAPAKLNLFLHVTGKRADGYHLLQSLVAFADIGDALDISPADDFTLDIKGPFAADLHESPQENLVWRAAQSLAQEANVKMCARITLHKNLPVASGLGGGSSDAAATLLGLTQLWGLTASMETLENIASRLGADVAACLYRRPLCMEGIGEKITPVENFPGFPAVLANPGVPTPTAAVFKLFGHAFRASAALPQGTTAPSWISALKDCGNDLTPVAIATTPAIAGALTALEKTENCLLHRLSGSGATCFGLYLTQEAAQKAAKTLRATHPAWWVETCRLTPSPASG